MLPMRCDRCGEERPVERFSRGNERRAGVVCDACLPEPLVEDDDRGRWWVAEILLLLGLLAG